MKRICIIVIIIAFVMIYMPIGASAAGIKYEFEDYNSIPNVSVSGAWSVANSTYASNGKLLFSNTSGSYIEISADMDAFTIGYYKVNTVYDHYVLVYLDDEYLVTLQENTSYNYDIGAKTYTASVPYGHHTVKLEVKNSNNSGWWQGGYIDYIIINRPPPPDRPQGLTVGNISSSTAVATWTGLSEAKGYKVYLNGSFVADTSNTSYALSNLNPGESYTVGVSYYNDSGESEKAIVSFTTKPLTVDLNAESTADSVTLTWSSGGGSATTYDIYQDNTKIANTANTSYTIPNLAERTKYVFKVIPKAGSLSADPATVEIWTKPSTPPLPPSLEVAGHTLQWTADETYQITKFTIYQDGNKVAEVEGDIFEYQVNGLEVGGTYNFVVTATNIIGESEPSNQVTIVPPTPPSPPTGFKALNVYRDKATLIWEPNIEEDHVTAYKIYQVQGDKTELLITLEPDALRYDLSDLSEHSQYAFYITAVNDIGESKPSKTVYISTSLPAPVSGLRVKELYENKAVITWDANAEQDAVTGYNIYLDGKKIATSSTNSYTLENLKEGNTYKVQVSAVNAIGESSLSYAISVQPNKLSSIGAVAQVINIFEMIGKLAGSIWQILALVIAIMVIERLTKYSKA